jgi:hypothetical protein
MKTKVTLSEQQLRSLIRDVLIEAPVPEGAGDDFNSLVTPAVRDQLETTIQYLGKFIDPTGVAGSTRFKAKLWVHIMNSPPHICKSGNTEMEGGIKFIGYQVPEAASNDLGPDALLINLVNFIACAFAQGKEVSINTFSGPKKLKPNCSLYSLAIGDSAYIGSMDPGQVEIYRDPAINFTVHDVKTPAGQSEYIKNVVAKPDVLSKIIPEIKMIEGAGGKPIPKLDYANEDAKKKLGDLIKQQLEGVQARLREQINKFNTPQMQYYLYEPLLRPTAWMSNPDLSEPTSSPWWAAWEACNIFARTVDTYKDPVSQNAACAAMVLNMANQAKKGVAFRATDRGWSSEARGGSYQTLLESLSGNELRVFLTEAQLKRLIHSALSLSRLDEVTPPPSWSSALDIAEKIPGVGGLVKAARSIGSLGGDAEQATGAAGAAARDTEAIRALAGAVKTKTAAAGLDTALVGASRVVKAINPSEADQRIAALTTRLVQQTYDTLFRTTDAMDVFIDNLANSVGDQVGRLAASRNFNQTQVDAVVNFCVESVKFTLRETLAGNADAAGLDAARNALIAADPQDLLGTFLTSPSTTPMVKEAVKGQIIEVSDSILKDPSFAPVSTFAKSTVIDTLNGQLDDVGLKLSPDGTKITFPRSNSPTTEYAVLDIRRTLEKYESQLAQAASSGAPPIFTTDTVKLRSFLDSTFKRSDADGIAKFREILDGIDETVGAQPAKKITTDLLETVSGGVVDLLEITLYPTLTSQATKAARQVPGATGAAKASRYADLILGGGTSSTASWLQSKMVIQDILGTWRRGGVLSKGSAVLKVASVALFTAPKTRADIGRGILTGSGWILTKLGASSFGPKLMRAGRLNKYLIPRIVGDGAIFLLFSPLVADKVMQNDPLARALYADLFERGGYTEFGGLARMAFDVINELGRSLDVDQELKDYLKFVADGQAPETMRLGFRNLLATQLGTLSDTQLEQMFEIIEPDANLSRLGPTAEFITQQTDKLGGDFGDALKGLADLTFDQSQEDISGLIVDVENLKQEAAQLAAEISRFGQSAQNNKTLTALKQSRVQVISQVLRLLDNMMPSGTSIPLVDASSAVSQIAKYEDALTKDYRRELAAGPTSGLFNWADRVNPDNLFYLAVTAGSPVIPDVEDPAIMSQLGASALYNGPGRYQDPGELADLPQDLQVDIGTLTQKMTELFADVYKINMAVNPPPPPESGTEAKGEQNP